MDNHMADKELKQKMDLICRLKPGAKQRYFPL